MTNTIDHKKFVLINPGELEKVKSTGTTEQNYKISPNKIAFVNLQNSTQIQRGCLNLQIRLKHWF